MRRVPQIVVVLALMALALPSPAQQSRVFREGASWVEETTGSLPAARHLLVSVQSANVAVQGGAQQEISYVVRKRARATSETTARRQFDSYRVSATRRGEMATLSGNSQGFKRYLSVDFTVNVPRAMDSVKLNTDGGNLSVVAVAGRPISLAIRTSLWPLISRARSSCQSLLLLLGL